MKRISWSKSDVGQKRDHNEDSFLVDEELGLYAVADGMGGHQGGAHASRMAVEVLRREVAAMRDFGAAARRLVGRATTRERAKTAAGRVRPRLEDMAAEARRAAATAEMAVEEDAATAEEEVRQPPPAALVLGEAACAAGRVIYDAAQEDPRLAGMGTTLTAVLLEDERAHVVHVGDSRAYLYRDGHITQVTDDHSWIAEQVRAGVLTAEEARDSQYRHVITRSVGFEREMRVDLLDVSLTAGDCLLLCSDGVTTFIEDSELAQILATTYYARVPQLLVDLANDRGGDDNITVVLVYVANGAE